MAEKLNILIAHNYYQIPGGEDTVVANEKKLLEEHGHKVILYTRNNAELKELSGLGKLLLPLSTIFNFRTYREVKKIIREEKIDILHVHNTLNLISPSIYYAGTSQKVPVVQTLHNFRLLCPGAAFYRDGKVCEECLQKGLSEAVRHNCYRESKLQTLACVISTKIHRLLRIYGKLSYIALTPFNKEKITWLKQIKKDRVFVKPNFTRKSVEPEEGEKRDFLYAGRLEEMKGISILLEAWRILGEDAPLLHLFGIGPMEAEARAYVNAHRLNVKFMGRVPNALLRTRMAKSLAVILPTQCYEGFPMTILEAFSVGTPVIASDLGNAGSLVVPGITGEKFSPKSPEELAQAVRSMMERPYRVSAAQFEPYTENANYQELLQIYEKVSEKGRG